MAAEEYFGVTPLPGAEYPLAVHYCGNCTMPVEVSRLSLNI